jgi:hypothetical protein
MYGDPMVVDYYIDNYGVYSAFDLLLLWAPTDELLERYRDALRSAAATFEQRRERWLPTETALEAEGRDLALAKLAFDRAHQITAWRIDHVADAVKRANAEEREHFLAMLGPSAETRGRQ